MSFCCLIIWSFYKCPCVDLEKQKYFKCFQLLTADVTVLAIFTILFAALSTNNNNTLRFTLQIKIRFYAGKRQVRSGFLTK